MRQQKLQVRRGRRQELPNSPRIGCIFTWIVVTPRLRNVNAEDQARLAASLRHGRDRLVAAQVKSLNGVRIAIVPEPTVAWPP